MKNKPLFTRTQYVKKIFNTFFPKCLFSLSPKKYQGRKHWGNQDFGDIHGFENYYIPHPRVSILIDEIGNLVSKDSNIIDLGCNCGYYLNDLKTSGYKSLTGVDISKNALEYGKKHFDLRGIDLIEGSFEKVIPDLLNKNKKYDLVYSMGATIELVHPSFDIIKAICDLSERYVILFIYEWVHSYPRFYEYEFNKHGFLMIKAIRPYNGLKNIDDPNEFTSLLIFQRI